MQTHQARELLEEILYWSPHPARVQGRAFHSNDLNAQAACARFLAGRRPVIIRSTDSLELLLDHTDLDHSTPVSRLTPLDSPAYYQFGETGVPEWSVRHRPSRQWIEGLYAFPESTDAYYLPNEQLQAHQLSPSRCRKLTLVVITRSEKAPFESSTMINVYLQDENEKLDRLITRTINAEIRPGSTLYAETADAALRHFFKISLYLSGEPELRYQEMPLATAGALPNLKGTLPVIGFGPHHLPKLLESGKVPAIAAPARWVRGRMSTRPTDRRERYLLDWTPPSLVAGT